LDLASRTGPLQQRDAKDEVGLVLGIRCRWSTVVVAGRSWDAGAMDEESRLDDRFAITEQMFRYARATDWLGTGDHRQVFTADCIFASPHSGDVEGVDAVVEWMNRVLAQFEATQHLIANISITFTGSTTATAVSYVRAWHRARDRARPDVVLWGEYHDRWAKVEGRWRIAERRVLEAGIEPRRDGGVPNPRRAKG